MCCRAAFASILLGPFDVRAVPVGWRATVRSGLLRAVALVFACLAGLAFADDTVRIVVPVNAGGSNDLLMRQLSRHLEDRVGMPVLVENRPGANTAIGTEYVIAAPPDGRTMLYAAGYLATGAALKQFRFDPLQDLTPVIKLVTGEIFLVVRSDLELERPAQLQQYLRSHPRGLSCAGVPGQMYLGCERLRLSLSGDMVSVPYPGAMPALTALMAGHVDMAFLPRDTALSQLASGRIRVIGTAGNQRALPPFEKLPLLKDTWPGMLMASFGGIYLPAAAPRAVVERLNRDFNWVLKKPEVRALLREQGYVPVGGPPEVLGKTLKSEVDYFKRLVQEVGIPAP